MIVTNNIYPPLIPDTIPAFVRNQDCKIYFGISPYNSLSEIQNVQISIINVKTNRSVLKKSLYPSDIKIAQII